MTYFSFDYLRRLASISANTRSVRAGLALAGKTPHPWPLGARLNPSSGRLRLGTLNLEIPLDVTSPILRDPIRAARLGRPPIGRFIWSDTAELLWTNDDVTVEVQTTEELLIIEEVFEYTHYNCANSDATLVFDVGMNVGYASLFFASAYPNARVIGFELLPPTSRQAERNLARNPNLSSRIKIETYGLGNADSSISIPYKKDLRGSVGAFTDRLRKFEATGASTANVEARIANASSAIDPLLSKYGSSRSGTILKIDTEGAEYDIIDSLYSSGLLTRFGHIMIEAHRRSAAHDPDRLVQTLVRSGFSVYHVNARSEDISMIYASIT